MRELDRRTRIINFRVNAAEFELIEQRAAQHQTSISNLARAAALQRREPRESSLLRRELQRLNSLLMHAYSAQGQLPELETVLQKLVSIEHLASGRDEHDR